ncbi:hypothetical protein E2C01_036899 [Portunus trituberculatus]|uniref:Uncharacterized protein n=1 Tax=Portunus trituberculatus TaxID=210409 RepID=A0A5B7FCH2_PORTR|nr:hypothetical protein [Portunus trituberculatus]
MQAAGIDLNIFSPHSTRSASTKVDKESRQIKENTLNTYLPSLVPVQHLGTPSSSASLHILFVSPHLTGLLQPASIVIHKSISYFVVVVVDVQEPPTPPHQGITLDLTMSCTPLTSASHSRTSRD